MSQKAKKLLTTSLLAANHALGSGPPPLMGSDWLRCREPDFRTPTTAAHEHP